MRQELKASKYSACMQRITGILLISFLKRRTSSTAFKITGASITNCDSQSPTVTMKERMRNRFKIYSAPKAAISLQVFKEALASRKQAEDAHLMSCDKIGLNGAMDHSIALSDDGSGDEAQYGVAEAEHGASYLPFCELCGMYVPRQTVQGLNKYFLRANVRRNVSAGGGRFGHQTRACR